MSNAGSGDFNLPFDATATAKEVEKQTKQAQKMLRDMSSYEGLIRATIAARKRIEGEIIREAAAKAATMVPPSVRRGQMSMLDPRSGMHSSLVMDPTQWTDKTVDVSPRARQDYINRPGAGGPETFMGKFKEGIDRASVTLERFASANMMAAGAALAVATASGAVQGYSARGEQANQQLGNLELLTGRGQRSLGMKARSLQSMITKTGDIEGASKFVESAIQMREQQNLTIPKEYVEMGLQAMVNGSSADEVRGWLTSFQFHKLQAAAGAGPQTQKQAQELNRRQMGTTNYILAQERASKEQRDYGAYSAYRDYDFGQQFPVLSAIPGLNVLAKTVYDLDPRSNPGLDQGAPLNPPPAQGPRGTSPVRQPGYDIQSGGRTGVIQVEIVGDRSRRPDPRTGNKE